MKRQIVDRSDNIIGAKTKTEMDYSVDIYRVSSVWLRNSKNELLIAQRSFTNSNGPGLWGPSAAGTVEEGESYDENIHKEIREEIGVENVSLKLMNKIFVDGQRKYFCQVYSGFINAKEEDFHLQQDEVASVRWISLADLIKDVGDYPERYVEGMLNSIKILSKEWIYV